MRRNSEIKKNTVLYIESEQYDAKSGETWCYTTYNGESGWVSRTSLSDHNTSIAVVRPDEYYDSYQRETVKVTRMGGLYLYSGPGDSYDIIMRLEEGDELTEEGYNHFSVKWAFVSKGGQYGWIKTYDGDWLNRTIETP